MTKRLGIITVVITSLLVSYPFLSPLLGPGEEATLESFYSAQATAVDEAYAAWVNRHEERGGDGNVVMSLRWSKGFSNEFTRAQGQATLDLINGSMSVEVQAVEDAQIGDVWLVDNQPGAESSVLPEPGDRMLWVGSLERNGSEARLQADLTGKFQRFEQGFEVDLVVISRKGLEPTRSRILMGSFGLFQRTYTKARLGRLPRKLKQLPPVFSSLGPQAALAFSSPDVPSFDPLIQEGADLFFNETFNGNGRTCGSCHPADNNFAIDPKSIATVPNNDPLFVAEFVPALAVNFEKPTLMRRVGLILENQDGFGDLANNFNMRGVPHTLALNTSLTPGAPGDGTTLPPDERTGWSGDGAPGSGTLREFAIGAVTQHFPLTLGREPGVDFRLPTESELDAMEAFQRFLGRQTDLALPLALKDELALRGQEIFLATAGKGAGKCNICHGNAGAAVSIAPGGLNFNFDTGVEDIADQPADLIDGANNPPDGGFGLTPGPDPFEFGNGTFNTPTLVEAADTGPFFHNNAVETIEGAVAFYNSDAFANSPSGQFLAATDPVDPGTAIDLEATQVVLVAAFLREINALENIRSALQGGDFIRVVHDDHDALSLLRVVQADVQDAIEVLVCGGLAPEATDELRHARSSLAAAKTTSNFFRNLHLTIALGELLDAQALLTH